MSISFSQLYQKFQTAYDALIKQPERIAYKKAKHEGLKPQKNEFSEESQIHLNKTIFSHRKKTRKWSATDIWNLRIAYKASKAYQHYLEQKTLFSMKTRVVALSLLYLSKDTTEEDRNFLAKHVVNWQGTLSKASRLLIKVHDTVLDLFDSKIRE